jgi:Holliday junction resolvasome RuvABC endonuclease subunit
MINISLEKLEKNLGYKIKKNSFVLAFDTASTTGISKIITTSTKVIIETSTMKLPKIPKDTEDKSEIYEQNLDMLLHMVRDLKQSITFKQKEKMILVLENSYLGFDPSTFGFLKGFMGLLYAELYDLFESIYLYYPSTARKLANFKSTIGRKHGMTANKARLARKQEIMYFISKIVEEKIEDNDVADALMLAFAGLREEK